MTSPNALEKLERRLAKARESWISLLSPIDDARASRRSSPSVWCPAEIGTHLVLTEEVIVLQFEKLLSSSADAPRARGLRWKRFLIPTVLIRSIHRPAPKFVVPKTPLPVEEILRRAETSRRRLIENARFASSQPALAQITLSHPFFGPLTLAEWCRTVACHEGRHARQMREELESSRP